MPEFASRALDQESICLARPCPNASARRPRAKWIEMHARYPVLFSRSSDDRALSALQCQWQQARTRHLHPNSARQSNLRPKLLQRQMVFQHCAAACLKKPFWAQVLLQPRRQNDPRIFHQHSVQFVRLLRQPPRVACLRAFLAREHYCGPISVLIQVACA